MHLKIFWTTGYCINGANYYLCVAVSFNSLVFFLVCNQNYWKYLHQIETDLYLSTAHQLYKMPEVSLLVATHALFEAGGH